MVKRAGWFHARTSASSDWTHCALPSRVYPTVVLNYLIVLALPNANNRQYDARTQLSGDGGGGAAARGHPRQPQRRPRPLPAAADVPPRPAGVGGVRPEAVPGGRGEPGAARQPPEGRAVHDPALAPGGNPRDQGVAGGAAGDAAGDRRLFRQRAVRAFKPQDRVAGGPPVWRAGRVALAGLSAHAAPRLRLRPGRPGCGHPADPGLPRPPQHPAHRPLHRRQPGTVREVVAVDRHPRLLAPMDGPADRLKPRARLDVPPVLISGTPKQI